MEIREMTAARIGREIKRKNLGVRETAEAFLEEIRQQEPRIHAFLSVDRKKTLERVRQVERVSVTEDIQDRWPVCRWP